MFLTDKYSEIMNAIHLKKVKKNFNKRVL